MGTGLSGLCYSHVKRWLYAQNSWDLQGLPILGGWDFRATETWHKSKWGVVLPERDGVTRSSWRASASDVRTKNEALCLNNGTRCGGWEESLTVLHDFPLGGFAENTSLEWGELTGDRAWQASSVVTASLLLAQ
jgi:hypothetical protein